MGATAGFFVGMGTAALTGNEEDAWTWAGFGALIGGGIPLLGSVNWGNNGRTASMREKILGSLLAAASNAPYIAEEAGYNPSADGVMDAIINAVLLGAPNLANELLGIDPLSRYSTEYDKESYSNSRSATDIAIAAAALSVSNGSNAAKGASLILALAGAETIVISGVALQAAALTKVLSVYSKGVSVAALADAKSIKVKFRNYKKAKDAKEGGKFKFPGTNPAKAPKGFEWKGKPGSTPGSKDGNWYNPKTGESLRPDLNHPDPIGPHWDYKDPSGK